jgi:hypothetical protein
MLRQLIAGAAFALAGCASHASLAPPSPPCSAPEHAQLDFWLGNWRATWEASPGAPAGTGTNTVVREMNGCVVRGGFVGGGLEGRSLSMYDARIGQWRQSWVDNQGGYYSLVGGPRGDRFVFDNTRLSPDAPYLRIVFEDITPDRFAWRWQRSLDAGVTWSDAWVIHYVRRASQ